MRSTTFTRLNAAVILIIVLGLGTVSISGLYAARWWDDRVRLSNKSYHEHLLLENNLFRLFKRYEDGLLIGESVSGVDVRALETAIDENIANIRAIIEAEIALVGEEELEEIAFLDRMETEIDMVVTRLATLATTETDQDRKSQLIEVLARRIEGRLADLFAEALAEEIEEMEETEVAAAAFRRQSLMLSVVFLATAIACLVASFVQYNRMIRLPLSRLTTYLGTLREGNYSKPTQLGGATEFQELEEVMSKMATTLAEREATREEQRAELARRVDLRTAELQVMINRLELGEDNRKRLLADISHELRTPLTIILGEAEVALRRGDKLPPHSADALARIRDSALHTNQIVDDLLTIARQEAGALRLDRQQIDLRQLLQDAAEMFPHDIQLTLPDDVSMAPVDAVRLRQAILAIFQNAQRYGGSTITAKLYHAQTGYQIAVEDDGPGMPESERLRAFERFYRGTNAGDPGIDGTGLGLPVVQSIVQAHGGSVALDPAALGGLRVTLTLPRGPLKPAADAPAPVRQA